MVRVRWSFYFFIKSKTTKMLSEAKYTYAWVYGQFWFFTLACIVNLLKYPYSKKKSSVKGYFCLFKLIFLLFIVLLRVLWFFNQNYIILDFKKLLACASHTSTSRRHLCTSGKACNTSIW